MIQTKRGDPGIEPGTSCTLSKNHTPRPITHFYPLRFFRQKAFTFSRSQVKARCELRGVRTLASEETRALSERLRPLGHQFIRKFHATENVKSLVYHISTSHPLGTTSANYIVAALNKRLWSSGYDWTLPTSRPGFDSRQTHFLYCLFRLGIPQKCSLRGSNPGPLAHKTNARPTELRGPLHVRFWKASRSNSWTVPVCALSESGNLAQLVARRSHNPKVASSILAVPSFFIFSSRAKVHRVGFEPTPPSVNRT